MPWKIRSITKSTEWPRRKSSWPNDTSPCDHCGGRADGTVRYFLRTRQMRLPTSLPSSLDGGKNSTPWLMAASLEKMCRHSQNQNPRKTPSGATTNDKLLLFFFLFFSCWHVYACGCEVCVHVVPVRVPWRHDVVWWRQGGVGRIGVRIWDNREKDVESLD